MVSNPVLFSTRALIAFLTGLVLLGHPQSTPAGCGCDKPPPAPAAVIPHFAFPGMAITLFSDSFQAGQRWTVTFHSGTATATTQATVVVKRALTDPTGATYKPQLVVPVPSVPMGPTRIVASAPTASLTVPEEAFTVIGKPVMVAEQAGSYAVAGYRTGVGADGTLYLSVGGLQGVCQPIELKGFFKNYPLRLRDGQVVVYNAQGFLIDALSSALNDYYFFVEPQGQTSDMLRYYRHSFQQYCAAHQPGGTKAVDALEADWHLDGTPHTEYATLVFAIAGHFDDGSRPRPGSAVFDLTLQAQLGDPGAPWAQEQAAEGVLGAR
jgi:hypothetical protein